MFYIITFSHHTKENGVIRCGTLVETDLVCELDFVANYAGMLSRLHCNSFSVHRCYTRSTAYRLLDALPKSVHLLPENELDNALAY